ncbi:thymidylate kinase [bacterium BMS3Bbin11]|nr:thymidylate kinase [bacterium BMS3Abin11]GBE46563.1 thymidylate kinase [bacterium BMS3Bbin11]GMT41117.1 MAG: thymidylate kinase [bacterium]HDH16759.1 dTMP kinase [Gammaproteobacteria bacterium]HDZ78707.1 dTMP kinase [Gammaproteobacteria bacterium]
MTGKFITLEGGEGAGKTTCLKHVEKRIKEAGIDLCVTREPGGTRTGEKIREILLDRGNFDILDETELLLMFAARAQHLNELIRPTLAADTWVLCDRFTDATYAYQGGGREIAHERIAELEQWVLQGLKPDLTFLLDLPVEVGLERAGQRSSPDRFESENIAFMERIRSSYLDIARQEPERVKIIDSSQALENVLLQIDEVLDDVLIVMYLQANESD